VTHDITKYTKASIFSAVGKKTMLFLRFSLVAPERGGADHERDVRGFAIKFYTDDGNWDLVGNNTPIFFVRDPLKFPDFIHSQKRDPRTNVRTPNMQWDFWSHHPESIHQVTMLMSDRGLPRSYREMHGFGSHTFAMINDKNQRHWVKFHFKTRQGIHNYTDDEAAEVMSKDRDGGQRDLYDAIERKDFPKWDMQIQLMTEKQADECPFNPFDLTKVWPHNEFPMIDVGVLELNRNAANYFAEVEQAAFNPANIVPGIGFSPDRMLQGRLFSYGDTHRYRLGVNSGLLAVNAPRCPYTTAHRDGFMRVGHVGGAMGDGFPPYQPDSYGGPSDDIEAFREPALKLSSATLDRWKAEGGGIDDFEQPRALFNLMGEKKQKELCENIARLLSQCDDVILKRQMGIFEKVHADYAAGVKKAIEAEKAKQQQQQQQPKKKDGE